MTGRPEKPLDPSAGPVANFAFHLRRLRQEAGSPSYRTMSSRTYYSVSALSIAAGGTRFPSWRCVEAYIRACGVRDEEIGHWKRRWKSVDQQLRDAKRAAQREAKAKARAEASKLSMEAVQMQTTVESRASLPVLDVRYVDANPAEVMTLEEFLIALDQMRVEKGLSFRQIAERSRLTTLPGTEVSGGLTRSQLHDMLNGRAPLRPRHVLAYLLACGVSQERAAEWLARLQKLRDQERRARAALAALQAQPDEAVMVTRTRTRTLAHVDSRSAEISSSERTPAAAPPAPMESADRGKHRQRRRWSSFLNRLTNPGKNEIPA